jgi:hypothetical protein
LFGPSGRPASLWPFGWTEEQGVNNGKVGMVSLGETRSVQPRQLIAAVETGLATLALGIVAATLWWLWQHNFAGPIYDDIYDRLRLYRSLPNGEEFLRYLVSAHNEHRIMTTRLVALVDELFFFGREHTQLIAASLFQALSAFVAYRFAFAVDARRKYAISTRLLVLGTLLLLFINPNFLYTLAVPFQLQHAIMTFLVVVAAALVASAPASEFSLAGQLRLVFLLLALALAGTFTLGNAPVILIAAATTAVILRWNFALTAALSILAVAHTGLVLATTKAVGNPSLNPVAMGKFALVYWGAPLLRFDAWPGGFVTWGFAVWLAAAFGAVVAGTAVGFGCLRLLKPRLGGPTATFGFVVLVVVVVTGLVAGHSRAQFGVLEAANKKYASFAGLGWLGVLAVAAGIAREKIRVFGRPEAPIFALLLGCILPLSISGYARETRLWQKMIDRNWEASLAVFLHVNDRNRLLDLYTDEAQLREYVSYIEPNGRGIFSYFSFRWGDDAKKFVAVRRPTSCRGAIERLDPIPNAALTRLFDAPGVPFVIAGWAWMDRDHAPPMTVIAVDAQDRIVGAARMTRASAAAEEWLGQKFGQNLGWFGFARLTGPPALSFFALSHDGRHFCALGSH